MVLHIIAAIVYFIMSGLLMTCRGSVVRKLAIMFGAMGFGNVIYVVVVVLDLIDHETYHFLVPHIIGSGALQLLVFASSIPFMVSFLKRGNDGEEQA